MRWSGRCTSNAGGTDGCSDAASGGQSSAAARRRLDLGLAAPAARALEASAAFSASQRSASRAAAQPEPAAVIAWR